MGLAMNCDVCGRFVAGVTATLKTLPDGRHVCRQCIEAGSRAQVLRCTVCGNTTQVGRMKGNGWIELTLYLLWIVPGIVYSVWRRSGPERVCPTCGKDALIPAVSSDAHP